jgi:predicted ATP-dependent serine protease
MLTLDRVVRRGSRDVHSIDLPYTGLQRLGFGLAKGQVGMIAAAPGVGKSALVHGALSSRGCSRCTSRPTPTPRR